ncbi:RIPP2 protein, partial [Atlantisia rogersi]|nr:RIPP2 protein [Atlantisia rogersi]
PRSLPFWRPWLPQAEEGTRQQRDPMDTVRAPLAGARAGPWRSGQRLTLLSPRSILWPRSKSFDYLYGMGEKLLENFPVQATLCFYEDSGSEEEEEEEEEAAGE